MQSAADVIADRGFEATTMAEIAARAGAPIGSLYRFFPNKEILAQSLVRRYAELVDEAFAKIEAGAKSQSTAALADAFLDLMTDLHGETQVVSALLDVHSSKRQEFRARVRQRIARILKMRKSKLSSGTSQNMAVVVVHAMKAMIRISTEEKGKARSGAMSELREMTRLYLASKLGT